MKKLFLFLLFFSISIMQTREMEGMIRKFTLEQCQKQPELTEWDIFLQALIKVESEGDQYAVGKTNDVGILQITPIYVKEANRLSKDKTFTLEDRTSIEKSLEMFDIVQSHWNPEKAIDKAIKLHNPKAGKWYANKIYKAMDEIRLA